MLLSVFTALDITDRIDLFAVADISVIINVNRGVFTCIYSGNNRAEVNEKEWLCKTQTNFKLESNYRSQSFVSGCQLPDLEVETIYPRQHASSLLSFERQLKTVLFLRRYS